MLVCMDKVTSADSVKISKLLGSIGNFELAMSGTASFQRSRIAQKASYILYRYPSCSLVGIRDLGRGSHGRAPHFGGALYSCMNILVCRTDPYTYRKAFFHFQVNTI